MFDFHTFLRSHFNKPQELVAFLTAYGAPVPQLDAVKKWFLRGTVPSEWFAVLVTYLGVENGGELDLTKYLQGGGNENK